MRKVTVGDGPDERCFVNVASRVFGAAEVPVVRGPAREEMQAARLRAVARFLGRSAYRGGYK